MTKDAIMYKLVCSQLSQTYVPEMEALVLPSDVNIGGMTTILPSQFHEKENRTFLIYNQGNLELDDQGYDNVQVRGWVTSFPYVNNGCARTRIQHEVGNQSVRD